MGPWPLIELKDMGNREGERGRKEEKGEREREKKRDKYRVTGHTG